jgi:hypothetical protein
MTANKPQVNKSEKIRELLQEMGKDASPIEIVKKLKGEGIKVAPNLVSTIKGRLFSKAAERRPERQPKPRPSAEGNLAVDDVVAVSQLAKKIGTENLKRLAEALGT